MDRPSASGEGEVSVSAILMQGGIAPHLPTVPLSDYIDSVEGMKGIDIQAIEVIVIDLHLGDIEPLPGIDLEEAEAFREAPSATGEDRKVDTAVALGYGAGLPHRRGCDLMVATGMHRDRRSRDRYLRAGVRRVHGPGLDRGRLLILPLLNKPARRNQCRGLHQAVLVMGRKVWCLTVMAPLILPGRSECFSGICTSF